MAATQLIRILAVAGTCTILLSATPSCFSGGATTSCDSRRIRPKRSEANMAQDFCHALQQNDRAALKALLDPTLAKLDARGDHERNFQAIKTWLSNHACVASVDIGVGVLRSDPPIKQFSVTLRTATPQDKATRDIGIRLSPKRYEFDSR